MPLEQVNGAGAEGSVSSELKWKAPSGLVPPSEGRVRFCC